MISEASIFTDALSVKGFRELSDTLVGIEFIGENIAAILRKSYLEKDIKNDLIKFIINKIG